MSFQRAWLVTKTYILIDSLNDDFDKTFLLISSIICQHRSVAKPIQLFKKELGTLPEEKVRQVKESMKIMFDLK